MRSERAAHLAARARVLKALAHPSRLLIVEALNGQEKCVAELTKLVGADVSTVSKHLAMLKEVGILVHEKRGTHVYYSLRVPCILNFFGCVESVLEASARDHLSYLDHSID